MNTHTVYGKPHRYLDLSHSSLPYWKIGSGPDLVFVHGWPVDSRTWRRVVRELSEDFTCHLFDLPGAGLSRWSPHTPLQLSHFPSVVAEAVSQMDLGGERFLFVGHDSGGGLARMAITDLKSKVAGYVLGNTEIPRNYSPLFRVLFLLGKTPVAGLLFRYLCQRGLTRRMFSLGRRWEGSELVEEMGHLFVEPLARFLGKMAAALELLRDADPSDFDRLAEAHREIEVPVHLVWGARDVWFPLEAARGMVSGFSGETSLQVLERCALMVHEEEPQIFAAAIRESAKEVSF